MAYDEEYEDAEDTVRLRPISVPDPTLPGSQNRAQNAAQAAQQARAQRAAQARQSQQIQARQAAQMQGGAGSPVGEPVDDETRVIALPGQIPANANGANGSFARSARSNEAPSDLRGLASGAFQEPDDDGSGEYGLTADQIAAKKKAKRAKARLAIIVTIVVIAILAIGGGVGWWLWHNKATSAAMMNCTNAASVLNQATSTFNVEKNSSATKSALTATSSEVVNGSLISSLHNNVARSVPKPLSCATSLTMSQLTSNARIMAQDAADLTKATNTMKTDVAAISKSKNDKLVSDARQSLTQLIASAQQTSSEQNSSVEDPTTISNLSSAISSAQQLLAQRNVTLDQLNKASQKITDAVTAVNESIQQKRLADQRRQQEEQSQQNGENDSTNGNRGANSGQNAQEAPGAGQQNANGQKQNPGQNAQQNNQQQKSQNPQNGNSAQQGQSNQNSNGQNRH